MSFYYNPMTIPIVGLLVVTVGQVVFKQRGENWLVRAWTTTLGIAWVVKLLSPARKPWKRITERRSNPLRR